LDRKERWDNVADAFACPESLDLSDLSVTLIDDVATTGATLDACAVALLTRGAKQVSALTLAHAV
jgi:predicted amidophosphoribosyltransferase